MKLQDILDQYHNDSAQASDIARNLNYALLGVVWILSKENVGNLVNYKILKYNFKLFLSQCQYIFRIK